jgi:hypothetical protein
MKNPIVFHPFFFAIYAVLGVYAQRPQEIPVQWVIRPIVFLLLATWLIYFAFAKGMNDRQRAGFVTTLILAWLFAGHLRNLIISTFSVSPNFLLDLLLLAAWGAFLAFLGSKRVWARIKIPELLTNFLNITSWVVILLPTYFVIVFSSQAIQQAAAARTSNELAAPVTLSANEATRPDIYVIILDAYGREDFLEKVFSHDNREFTDFLRARGFYVADQSRTNYPQTQLSISALFNFNYLNDWAKQYEQTNNRGPLAEAIRHSEARRALEEIGYKTVNIPNSTLMGDIEDSAIRLPMTAPWLNQFDGLVIATSALDVFIRAFDLNIPSPSYDMHRRTIEYQFETLQSVPPLAGPKLVFVHILAPHPPFVLDELGSPIEPPRLYTIADGDAYTGTMEEYISGYTRELKFVNSQAMKVVDAILAGSDQPPIIILQGDHGPGSRFGMLRVETENCLWERYSILNAYYFPDQNYEKLYPTITPVNSFRVIFNTYFGTELPLLEDKNYYASFATPYKFEEVTARIGSSCHTP